MSIFKRRPTQLQQQLAEADREIAEGRLLQAVAAVQAEPPRIHNPNGGTRSHYRDSSGPDLKPVCKASGRHWDEGDGGLELCGLCPHMWAQRQASTELGAAS